MLRLTHSDAVALRAVPGATLVLFLTDRCPVGCGHCSVSSRVDGDTISDWPLFTGIVDAIAAIPSLRAVAITGGEPFAERRGLIHAVHGLAGSGKAVVVFTSGHWARSSIPPWITAVLSQISTVYLSTDTFHAGGLARAAAPAQTATAVAAIEAAGCRLVLQVLDEPGAAQRARALSSTADISVVAPLPVGRGSRVFAPHPLRSSASFGRCSLLNSPTVRYDGRVSACCNEDVITGHGPPGLRRDLTDPCTLPAALESFRDDPVLHLMAAYGPAAVQTAASGPFRSICDACWAAHDRAATDPKTRLGLTLLGRLP
jgi:hypothetical protein